MNFSNTTRQTPTRSFMDGTVGLYDATNGAAINEHLITEAPWTRLALDSSNRFLYVANGGGAHPVYKYDAFTGELLQTISVGFNPTLIATDPLGYLYAARADVSGIYLARTNLVTGEVTAQTFLGRPYAQMQAMEFVVGKLLVSYSNVVDVLDAVSLAVTRPALISGYQPWDLAFDGDHTLYVINISNDWLEVWDTDTFTRTNPNLVPPNLRDFPMQLAMDGNGRLFLADSGESADVTPAIQVYGTDGTTLNKTFVVGSSKPYGVVYSPLSIAGTPVPEPGTWGLFGVAASVGLISLRLRRKRR